MWDGGGELCNSEVLTEIPCALRAAAGGQSVRRVFLLLDGSRFSTAS